MVCTDKCVYKFKTLSVSGVNSMGRPRCSVCDVRFLDEWGIFCPCCGSRLSYRIKGRKNNKGALRV